jgi:hypothetical protein
MGCNGCSGGVNSEIANTIAYFLDEQLKHMTPGQRLRADLTATNEPKRMVIFTPGMKVEDIDAAEIYSATYEWLVIFRDFCRTSAGFKVS